MAGSALIGGVLLALIEGLYFFSLSPAWERSRIHQTIAPVLH